MAASVKQWNPGDVVKLKSGGPKMTVDLQKKQDGGGEAVYCIWFDKNEIVQKDMFPPALLEAVN